MSRILSEEDAFRQMSPIDQLRVPSPQVGPEQAAANRQQNLRDLLSIVPGPGNVIAAEDASQAFGDASDYAAEGRYGRAALSTGLGALSAFGAVTGLPFGRLAGNAAKGASSRTNIFAGPMAKTADQAALAKAQEMAESGVGRDSIHAQTGWFQGVDGKWRFEIDDTGAQLTGFQKGKSSRFTGLDHPDLEAAYGRLAPVHGLYAPGLPETGSYQSMRVPYVAAQGRNPQSAKSVTLHEFQHGAQDAEGFATGGNPRQFSSQPDPYGTYRRLAGEVEARNVQSRMNMTAAERRAKAPWLTQDVPDDQQIVWGR